MPFSKSKPASTPAPRALARGAARAFPALPDAFPEDWEENFAACMADGGPLAREEARDALLRSVAAAMEACPGLKGGADAAAPRGGRARAVEGALRSASHGPGGALFEGLLGVPGHLIQMAHAQPWRLLGLMRAGLSLSSLEPDDQHRCAQAPSEDAAELPEIMERMLDQGWDPASGSPSLNPCGKLLRAWAVGGVDPSAAGAAYAMMIRRCPGLDAACGAAMAKEARAWARSAGGPGPHGWQGAILDKAVARLHRVLAEREAIEEAAAAAGPARAKAARL